MSVFWVVFMILCKNVSPDEDELVHACLLADKLKHGMRGTILSYVEMKMNITEFNVLQDLCFQLCSLVAVLFTFNVHVKLYSTRLRMRDHIVSFGMM